jgi:hypothetical protein
LRHYGTGIKELAFMQDGPFDTGEFAFIDIVLGNFRD